MRGVERDPSRDRGGSRKTSSICHTGADTNAGMSCGRRLPPCRCRDRGSSRKAAIREWLTCMSVVRKNAVSTRPGPHFPSGTRTANWCAGNAAYWQTGVCATSRPSSTIRSPARNTHLPGKPSCAGWSADSSTGNRAFRRAGLSLHSMIRRSSQRAIQATRQTRPVRTGCNPCHATRTAATAEVINFTWQAIATRGQSNNTRMRTQA